MNFINWIKGMVQTKDTMPIGLKGLKRADDIVSKPKEAEKKEKTNKDVKISDLMKGKVC